MQENIAKKGNKKLLLGVSSRFSDYLKAKNIVQDVVAKWFGVSRQSISNIKNGKSGLTTEHLIILKKENPQLNIDWLLFGKGEMSVQANSYENDHQLDQAKEKPTSPNYNDKPECTNPKCLKRIAELEDDKLLLKEHIQFLKGGANLGKLDAGGVEKPQDKTGTNG